MLIEKFRSFGDASIVGAPQRVIGRLRRHCSAQEVENSVTIRYIYAALISAQVSRE